MLKDINPILTGDLLKVLDEMGHGDGVAIVDGNFAAYSHATFRPPVDDVPSSDVITVVRTILTVFPLDTNAIQGYYIVEREEDELRPITEALKQTVDGALNTDAKAGVALYFDPLEAAPFREAVKEARAVVVVRDPRHYGCCILRKGAVPELTASNPTTTRWDNMPIEELEFGVRTCNCLNRAGVRTVGDLLAKSEKQLQSVPNFGQKSIDEIKEVLDSHNLELQQR